MITLKSRPTDKILELGGGAHPLVRPNVDVRFCEDAQGRRTVDVVADFEKPLPLEDQEYDGVFSQYCIEHITWRNTQKFVKEIYRILKPGGKAVIITANTEAQIQWIKDHPGGWDDQPPFESFSCVLFGDSDYAENSHKAYFDTRLLHHLFHEAGFEKIEIQPYGARDTDFVLQANRPAQSHQIITHSGKITSGNVDHGTVHRSNPEGKPIVHEGKIIGIAYSGQVPGTNVGQDLPPQAQVNTKIEAETLDQNEDAERAVRSDSNDPGERVAADDLNVTKERADQTDSNAKRERGEETEVSSPLPNLTGPNPTLPNQTSPNLTKPDLTRPNRTGPDVTGLGQYTREELFDKDYFNGGKRFGGYAREGYRDFPAHEITFRHLMIRRPESVLEIGCARGYILKRLQDVGIRVTGLEVSKHCFLTRAVEDVFLHDICQFPWPIPDNSYDLCFSIATMEHIPEEFLPGVLGEMKRICKRGLHGIDFGEKDDGFDKTHCTLKSREWWLTKFSGHFGYGLPVLGGQLVHEILNKEELEQGKFPEEVLKGDGRCKLNIGCFTNMYYQGWINIDQHDLIGFAQQQGYQFQRVDIRQGLPFATGSVDLIHMSHFLEHLSAKEGLTCLKECRRVMKPDGAIRIACPDTELLVQKYTNGTLDDFAEVSDGVEGSPTQAGKLWELLFSGHQMAYDKETLCRILEEAGFVSYPIYFRKTEAGEAGKQLLRETLDIVQCLSVFVDAKPLLG